jgi:hypothetical protein
MNKTPTLAELIAAAVDGDTIDIDLPRMAGGDIIEVTRSLILLSRSGSELAERIMVRAGATLRIVGIQRCDWTDVTEGATVIATDCVFTGQGLLSASGEHTVLDVARCRFSTTNDAGVSAKSGAIANVAECIFDMTVGVAAEGRNSRVHVSECLFDRIVTAIALFNGARAAVDRSGFEKIGLTAIHGQHAETLLEITTSYFTDVKSLGILALDGAQIRVEGCAFEAVDGSAVEARVGSRVAIRGCHFESIQGVGVHCSGSGSAAEITDSRFARVQGSGVVVEDGAKVDVSGSHLADLTSTAVEASGSGSRVDVHDSSFKTLGHRGVAAVGGAAVKVSNSSFQSVERAAVGTFGAGSTAEVDQSHFSNVKSGVAAVEGAEVIVRDCSFDKADHDALVVTRAGGSRLRLEGRSRFRGRDQNLCYDVAAREAAQGGVHLIRSDVWVPCGNCNGSGGRPGSVLRQYNIGDKSQEELCELCGGNGGGFDPRAILLRLPAGVKDGQELCFAGRGAPGFGGGEPGDLTVSISVRGAKTIGEKGQEFPSVEEFFQTKLGVTVSSAEAQEPSRAVASANRAGDWSDLRDGSVSADDEAISDARVMRAARVLAGRRNKPNWQAIPAEWQHQFIEDARLILHSKAPTERQRLLEAAKLLAARRNRPSWREIPPEHQVEYLEDVRLIFEADGTSGPRAHGSSEHASDMFPSPSAKTTSDQNFPDPSD